MPSQLSRADIIGVVKSNLKYLKVCTNKDPNLKGKLVTIMIGITHNGKVRSAIPSGRHLRNSPQKSCILKVIKGLKFPAFTSDSMQIPLPIRLQ